VKRFSLIFLACLTACAQQAIVVTPIPPLPALPSSTSTPLKHSLWIGPGVPDQLRQAANSWGIPLISDAGQAAVRLDVLSPQSTGPVQKSVWTYALVAPFPTGTDGVTSADLRAAWSGAASGPFSGRPLWMSAASLAAFTSMWGPPATGAVQVLPPDQLLDNAWKNLPSWAIVPFEALEPKWKVLSVDGQSPIHKDFDASKYPLQITFALQLSEPLSLSLPALNRDPAKMTVLIMTGTTSLVRWLAYKMEINGIDYPGLNVLDWLKQADIVHVSNEVSFDPTCPPPNPMQSRFYCSDPKYLSLLKDVGVNVVELTGNHNIDNGAASALYTLNLYKQNNISVFGGGMNLADSRKPLLMEDHGNKIAFVGCNEAGPLVAWATDNTPGANPCDYKILAEQISGLRAQGYLVIDTFQYREGYTPSPMPWQWVDFHKPADAGATIVSGSQAHFPMSMEFYKDTFIHFGLGNFFFDQMGNISPGNGLRPFPTERREFVDRHVFYDGRYVSTELLTAMLEDYSQPRPMTSDERAAFLQEYFEHSGWIPFVPTPAPYQTPTLYPLPNFDRLPTHTPIPRTTPTP
jgi:Bacterial capsule synthesis protein PGA_cap